ncbi:hypothetical protein N480_12605 [Pseudoalteromonas luteoviolacea S2607]|nr:hypothetical protein N480_12605 [Pseudoalteromonas luteoviolacea S2607]
MKHAHPFKSYNRDMLHKYGQIVMVSVFMAIVAELLAYVHFYSKSIAFNGP